MSFRLFLVSESGNLNYIFWIAFPVAILIELFILCGAKISTVVPYNYLLLTGFTASFSICVASVCSLVY